MRRSLYTAFCCIAVTASACSPVSHSEEIASAPTSIAPDALVEASGAAQPVHMAQRALPTTPSISAAQRWNAEFDRLWGREPSEPIDATVIRELAAAASQAEAALVDSAPVSVAETPCTMDEYCERDRPSPARFVDIAAAKAHTCGLLADGRVQCWGTSWFLSPDDYTGTASNRTSSNFARIDAQGGVTCGLRADTSLFCWFGEGGFPRGRPFEWEPPRPYESGSYTDFAVSDLQVCALDLDGQAECWPFYHWDEPLMAAPPPRLGNLSFASIDAGAAHVCGLHHDRAIHCWGSNDAGQIDAPAGQAYMNLSAGAGHTCALTVDGVAECWGDNSFGQSTPPADTRFSALSAGELHTCGLQLDGATQCWGSDIDGQASPPAGIAFSTISAGAHHTCALTTTGESRCWGLDAYGQATPPPALAQFARLFTGWQERGSHGPVHSCGLRVDGRAQCWGEGQDPSRPVHSGARYTEIAVGNGFACGILLDGRASCWRYYPEFSHNRLDAVIARVPRELRFATVVTARNQACGLTMERTIRCWGPEENRGGDDSPPPPAGGHIAIAASEYYVCAISNGGSIGCWSDGRGLPSDLKEIAHSYRGVTSIGEHFGPDASLNAKYRALALGDSAWYSSEGSEGSHNHMCSLRENQVAVCWGADKFGQASPPSGVRFRSISAGGRHTCGITVEGTTRCWGANDIGQSTPPAGVRFFELTADHDSTCGLRHDGEVICWGNHGLSAPAQLIPFDANLPERHSTDIKQLDRLGILNGTECSTQRFCTDAPLTRATLAVWLDRLLEHEDPSTAPESTVTNEFDDVPVWLWWANHAQRLANLDVMTPCDTVARLFCPYDHVSRAEFEQALVRTLENHLHDGTRSAPDAAVASAHAAIGADVLSTCIDREPRACQQTAVTRGQAATVLNRFSEHMERLAPPEFTSVSANSEGGCGRRSDGSVECWGEDWSGEAYVATDDRVLDVFYDGHYWCGRTVSRQPTCHGWDGYNYSHVHDALDIARRTKVAFGSVYACGIESDKTLSCVGGVPTDGSPMPYEVAAPSTTLGDRFDVVAVGYLHRCVLRLNGSPVCWGKNEFGEASPPADERFSHLTLGVSHSCGLRLDGSVECWATTSLAGHQHQRCASLRQQPSSDPRRHSWCSQSESCAHESNSSDRFRDLRPDLGRAGRVLGYVKLAILED